MPTFAALSVAVTGAAADALTVAGVNAGTGFLVGGALILAAGILLLIRALITSRRSSGDD